jgi:SAM-dependent methyltransferase
VSSSEFKYVTDGAYHFRVTENPRVRRFDPRIDARYEVPLAVLRAHAALDAGKRGVDLGCGDGVMLFKIQRAGGKVVGLDLSLAGLRIARDELTRRTGVAPALARASASVLPFAPGSLDYVTSIEVIEHLQDADVHLAEVRRVLAPGGVLVVTTPHRLPSGELQDPYHVVEFDAASLEALLRRHFASVEVRGMYPALLDRIYYRASGFRPLDKVVRGGFKVVSRWLMNPYVHMLKRAPRTGWRNLVAICRV